MTSLAILLTTFAVLLLHNCANSASASRHPREYAPETTRNAEDHTLCCVIPTCDQEGRCYETLSCGYICSQGRYRPANIDPTSGYKRKVYYSKYACKFGVCQEYKFLCQHCPNPDEPDFSFYTIRDDCRNCYDRPQY